MSSSLFASQQLAARLERAECALLAAGAGAARRRDPACPVLIQPLAGGLAVWAGAGSPLDKVAGLGFGPPLDEGELGEVERSFAERGTPVRVELACLADPTVGETLTRRGYRLRGFENVLARALGGEEPGPDAAAIPVTPCGEEDFARWLDVVVTGFAHPDGQGVPSDEEFPRETLERIFRDLASAAGFRRYLAWRDGRPAGGASLRIGDGVAQLCGAATLPAERRRGVQTALLAARLADAAAAGCDLAVVTTQPGSKSQQNVQRQGFELLYTRAILLLER
jgi:hypothetical protein